MNKATYYQDKKKIALKKRKQNNLYRFSLIVIVWLIIIFVICAFSLIIFNGVLGFFKYSELNLQYFLFGGYYDGQEYIAAGFMVINTIWITFLALLIAVPISVFTALFVTRMAPKQLKNPLFITISILAAIPSVIYGAFAKSVIDNIVITIFGTAPGSILTIVIMLAFMIMPTITLLSVTAINAVNPKLEQSSLALGATKQQTSINVTLRSAKKGITVAIVLGIARALGEATAVSMVASQPNIGPTLGLFGNIRLLTSTMLQGFTEIAPGTVQEASMYAMGMLLLITIGLVFISLTFLENLFDDNLKSKKSVELMTKQQKLYSKIKVKGMENLTTSEQNLYIKFESKNDSFIQEYEYQRQFREEVKISRRFSVEKKTNSYKKTISKFQWLLTLAFSLVGIVLLLSIIIFLLWGGLGVLSWDYLSSSGEWQTIVYDNYTVTLYGLSTAIFGTLVVIFLSLLIALPFGILTGIYFSIYLKEGNRFERFFSFIISILIAIPSLIYGIIGLIIFVPIANLIGINSLAGGLIMSIVILPTIIKTTQQALNEVSVIQKQGSLALGATQLTTVNRVMLRQISPTIISAAILSIGRVMGESAIFIIIFGTANASSNMDWIQNGGTTLATEIYKLTLLEIIPWEYVKAISIIIILLILAFSLLATYIKEKQKIQSICFSIALVILFASIFLSILFLFLFSLASILFIVIVPLIYNFINKNQRLESWIKNKYYQFKIK